MRDCLVIVKEINETSIEDTEKMEGLAEELYLTTYDVVLRRRRYAEPKETTEAIRSILRHISVIPDNIKQMIWLKKLALEYNLKEDLLIKELKVIKDKIKQANLRREQYKKKK